MDKIRVYIKSLNEFAESVYEINFEDKLVRIENGDYYSFDEVEFCIGEDKIVDIESKSKKYDECQKWVDEHRESLCKNAPKKDVDGELIELKEALVESNKTVDRLMKENREACRIIDESLKRVKELEEDISNCSTKDALFIYGREHKRRFDVEQKLRGALNRISELEIMKNDYIDIINKQDDTIKVLVEGVKVVTKKSRLVIEKDDSKWLEFVNDDEDFENVWLPLNDEEYKQYKAMLELVEVEK